MSARKNFSIFIKDTGKSLTDFAASVGVSISQLSQIINGKQEGTFIFWSRVADTYGISFDDLMKLYQRGGSEE